MPWGLSGLSEDDLIDWIEAHVSDKTKIRASGYQGKVYLYQDEHHRLVIKTASGPGLVKRIRQSWLRKEHEVYRRLSGFAGSPRCYGLLRDRYLVLEYIDGIPFRSAKIADAPAFFDRLFELIQELHRRGVAHADLKRKDNLLVVEGRTPYLIDFGAAMIYKPGFAPINHYLYEVARKFDLNAWVKLKYRGKFADISDADREYYNQTWIEKIARAVKKRYKKIKSLVLHPNR